MTPLKLSDPLIQSLRDCRKRWVLTGSAGFIGSNLLETLLHYGQSVASLDNFATGHQKNLDAVRDSVGDEAWKRHTFIRGDIADYDTCVSLMAGADVVLHQAAIGSVPRSLEDPLFTHRANATGFLNVLEAARRAKVSRFIYAASSSTYGDSQALPKVESNIGNPLSPYAVTKYLNELYADVFTRCYGMQSIGLRYFNVFGPRQDPFGPYSAAIALWIGQMLSGVQCRINGDGLTSRDFCYVSNAVQANLLAALTERDAAVNQVYNVAAAGQTNLNQLHQLLREALLAKRPDLGIADPCHAPFRAGDIRHSFADITKARELLGYAPTHDIRSGIRELVAWWLDSGFYSPGRP